MNLVQILTHLDPYTINDGPLQHGAHSLHQEQFDYSIILYLKFLFIKKKSKFELE